MHCLILVILSSDVWDRQPVSKSGHLCVFVLGLVSCNKNKLGKFVLEEDMKVNSDDLKS